MSTKSISFEKEIGLIQQQISKGVKNPGIRLDIEIQIDNLARKIITTPTSAQVKKEAFQALKEMRCEMISHVPVNGITTGIFLNLDQPTLPTPLCPAYNRMRFPVISTYHAPAANIGAIKLDPQAIQYVPKTVLDQVDLKGKQVDLLWTAIDGRPFPTYMLKDGILNLGTHAWSHPHALPGDDVYFDVNMGIFPEVGFQKAYKPGSVAVNTISPMNVHCHGKANNMLYSPDNAHITKIEDTPFGIAWVVSQKDQRIAITKIVVIFDYEHPICRPIVSSIRNAKSLSNHLGELKKVAPNIQHYFDPLIKAFDQEDEQAMELFKKLPLAFQNEIYKQAWISSGSPKNIHGDFGKAAFENDPSLNKKYHLNAKTRSQVIGAFAQRLEDLLWHSQMDLLVESQSLVKGDNVLKMMQCAQRVYANHQEAKEICTQLSKEQLEARNFAIWELSGCPRGDNNFGGKTFENPYTPRELKFDSLLTAASRQSPVFDQPLIENIREEKEDLKQEVEEQPKVDKVINTENLKKEVDDQHLEEEIDFTFLIDNYKIEIKEEQPQTIFDKLFNLVCDDQFHAKANTEKAKIVNDFLAHLSKNFLTKLYGRVYDNSNDPLKGGDSWGEKHVADDLNTLILSFQEVMDSNSN